MRPLRSLAVGTALAIGLGAPTAAQLNPPTPYPSPAMAGHIVRRTSYGARDVDVQAMVGGGPSAIQSYLYQQLYPNPTAENQVLIDALAILAASPVDDPTENLQTELLLRQCLSNHQLQMVMAYFWDVHFNTSISRIKVRLELWLANEFPDLMASEHAELANEWAATLEGIEADAFRDNALGSFYDLLYASWNSSSMRLYLNLFGSDCDPPNEDYARELLELHTLGVADAQGELNYSQADVEAVAEILTGSSVVDTTPFDPVFDPNAHCTHPVATAHWTLFTSNDDVDDVTIDGIDDHLASCPPVPTGESCPPPSGCWSEPEQLLWKLANHSGTARFVCSKLMRVFLADDADHPALLDDCVDAWGTCAGGDIAAALSVILESNAFQGGTYRWDRTCRPSESVVSMYRHFKDVTGIQADVALGDMAPLLGSIKGMGETYFAYPSPEGLTSVSTEQVGSQLYIGRVESAKRLLESPRYTPHLLVQAGLQQFCDPAQPSLDCWNDKEKVTEFLLTHLFQKKWTAADVTRGIAVLGPAALDHATFPFDWEKRVSRLAVFVTSLPQALER